MAGGSNDWNTLIDHQSSLLTETKNLVCKTEELLNESKAQSKQNGTTMTLAIITLLASVVSIIISIAKP